MRRAVVVLCLVQCVDVLGVTSATTAIPAMLAGVDAPASAAGPLATVYAMCFGGVLVLGARLGDRFGAVRVLVVGVTVLGAVSLAGAWSANVGELIAVRGLQGVAAAISVPSALRLLLAAAGEGPARTSALAAWSAVGAAAGAGGFLIGGGLTSLFGWQAVLLVNVPVAALLLLGIGVTLRDAPRSTERTSIDLIGAALLLAAVAALIAGAAALETASSRSAGAALVAAGLVLAGLLAVRLRTAAAPLVPRAAVRMRNLRRGTAMSFVNTAATSSAAVLATLELQEVLRRTPFETGLILLPISVAVILGAAASRRVARAGDDRLGAAGLLGIAIGDGALALTAGTWWGVAAGGAVLGFGLGLASVAGTSIGTAVPPASTGSATGVINTGAQLGTALGTAAIVLVAAITSPAVGWAVAGAAAVATAAWCLLRSPSRPAP